MNNGLLGKVVAGVTIALLVGLLGKTFWDSNHYASTSMVIGLTSRIEVYQKEAISRLEKRMERLECGEYAKNASLDKVQQDWLERLKGLEARLIKRLDNTDTKIEGIQKLILDHNPHAYMKP